MTPHTSTHLPLLPTALTRRYHCADPLDTRFRAAARLLQSLWRERNGFPCGHFRNDKGRAVRLGSRLTPHIAATGANLVAPQLIPFVRRELAYREVGAFIDPTRLWTNLLASHPLTFSLFGPLKRDHRLAEATLRPLFPDLIGTVDDILFEHSPGRGDPDFTADHTAFDVLVRCTTPAGASACIAIEIKYSEAPGGAAAPAKGQYDTLSRRAGVYRNADSPALRNGNTQQFWREQLLLTAMLERGLYDQGRFVIIAPALNRDCQTAITRYQRQLVSTDPAETRFQSVTLEAIVAALDAADAVQIAAGLTERYLDFAPVHQALATALGLNQPS